MSLRVLIAGGGLGGLTLAHGLRRAGLQPIVFERGPAHLDLSASYRIHINANGSRALHACLPDHVWHSLEARSAASPLGIAFTTERLHALAFIPEDDAASDAVAQSHPISRSGLRQLLLSDMDDVVRFDTRVIGYEPSISNEVVARLADGTSVRGDVLVGADGSASAIRTQLLPHARVVDSGVGSIAGKVYLNDQTRALIGPRLLRQMTMVLPVRGMAMFLAPFQRRGPDTQLDLPEHLFWVLIGRATDFRVRMGVGKQSPEHAWRDVLHIVQSWHPLLRGLVEASDPSSMQGVPLHTAEPVGAWPTTRVTLLGDAIHTMTPLQGLGGNTALVDAALLCQKLVEADRGQTSLLTALGEYEAMMRRYGFDAMQRSLQVSSGVSSHNVPARLAFRAMLRLATRFPAVQHRLFRREEPAPLAA